MIKVFIVDDHFLVREGLQKILMLETNIAVVGEAGSASETLVGLRTTPCDVLILDIALPDKSGLEILKELKTRYPALRVLVLSMYTEERYALRSFRNGADGYLAKSCAAEELVLALRTIMKGKKYISPAVAQVLAGQLYNNGTQPAHQSLSDREFKILLLLGSGNTVTQIAKALNLSVSTVNTHRTHILEKMNMKTTVELIRYVVENFPAE